MSNELHDKIKKLKFENMIFQRALRNIAASSNAVSMGPTPKNVALTALQRVEHVKKTTDEL